MAASSLDPELKKMLARSLRGECANCGKGENRHASGWCVGQATRYDPYTREEIAEMTETATTTADIHDSVMVRVTRPKRFA